MDNIFWTIVEMSIVKEIGIQYRTQVIKENGVPYKSLVGHDVFGIVKQSFIIFF